MSLFLHLLIHLMLAILAGFIVFRIWKKPVVSFLASLAGGVGVDFDHFIDYYLAFGKKWNMAYFQNGYQFLKSDKLYILFHGWEYVIILILAVFIMKNRVIRSIFLALALGLFFHLCADVVIDGLPVSSYSVINRARNNFSLEQIVYPEHWQKHLKQKKSVYVNF